MFMINNEEDNIPKEPERGNLKDEAIEKINKSKIDDILNTNIGNV